MFSIIVTEKGGEQRRLEFDKSEVTIGRVQGNDVILPKGNVSKRHARIVLKDGKFIIVDLKSTNGTYVNGRKITSPLVVKESDKIYIGDFILGVQDAGMVAPEPPGPPGPPGPPSYNRPSDPASSNASPRSSGSPAAPRPPAPPPMPPPGPPPPAPPPSSEAGPAPGMGAPPHGPAGSDSGPPLRPRVPAPAGMQTPGGQAAPNVPPPGGPSPAPRPMADNSAPAPVPTPEPAPPPQPEVPPPAAAPVPARRPTPRPAPRPMPRALGRGIEVAPLPEDVQGRLQAQDSILDRLIPRLDLDNLAPDKLGDEETEQKARSAIVDLVETMSSSGDLPAEVNQDRLVDDVIKEALGLGPLEDLLSDGAIEEIIVDRRDRIVVRRDGKLAGSGTAFSSDGAFRRVVERLVVPTGHSIDESSPLVDVRLRDGVHLTAAVPPVAVRGVCLTLRKPRSRSSSMAELVSAEALSQAMADFLTTCVAARRNVLVCGAPGSEKNAVIAALAGASPPGERIVSVEEVAELALGRDAWIALEARPGDGNGVPAVGLGALLQSALRLGADRLVVGEVRGAEAFELISAMAASTDGALVASAGDGSRAALARLTALGGLGAPGASSDALRHLVACAIDVVVHVARYADGIVRIASIDEVVGGRDDGFETRALSSYGGGGGFAAAGVVPGFYGGISALGIPADPSIFQG